MDPTLMQQLINGVNNINLGPQEQVRRQKGFLEMHQMNWQKNVQTLFQLKQIYIDRLLKTKQRFKIKGNHTIEDLSNEIQVPELVGIFKRIQFQRVRAFQPNYKQRYEYNVQVYSQKDDYQLQDQTGKIRLELRNAKYNNVNFKPIYLPYGAVIKCVGKYHQKLNRFFVQKIFNPSYLPQAPLRLPKQQKYILAVNEPNIEILNKLRAFFINTFNEISRNVVELIIIGGVKYGNSQQIKDFDSFISQMGEYIDTFIVPSTGEHRQHLYPLRCYHKSVLPKALSSSNLGNCANPQMLQSKSNTFQLKVLVSCGQNLLNLKANCQVHDELQLMKMIIQLGHMCPSSGFSLPINSYSFDPLVLQEIPHLMIHGKCQRFDSTYMNQPDVDRDIKVRFVALAQGDMALIDLSTNELKTSKFTLE